MIIADTHAWLWWLLDRRRLSRRAGEAFRKHDVAISSVTLYEVTQLAERQRIRLDGSTREWLRTAVMSSRTAVLSIDADVAMLAGSLPRDISRDPIDRLIVASAIHHRSPVITADRKINAAGVVETIW